MKLSHTGKKKIMLAIEGFLHEPCNKELTVQHPLIYLELKPHCGLWSMTNIQQLIVPL